MPWSGSGTFNRIYSWQADAAAGIDITASRFDTQESDFTSNGFGNCLTRDGQGSATANLPMNNFKFTGLASGTATGDSCTVGQMQATVQSGLQNWAVASGTSDAITASYSPAITALADGLICCFRATAANATSTPTFTPNSGTVAAHTITKFGGLALNAGDIPGNFAEVAVRYNLANTRWELLNPATLQVRSAVNDAAYSVKVTDRDIAYTAISSARTVSLPAASAYPAGTPLWIGDESGSCSSTKTITASRNGSDTINGGSSAVVNSPYGYMVLLSNGSNAWTATIFANLATQDQTLSGGANVTFNNYGNFTTGTLTVDCGKSPLAHCSNNGAFTIAAPSNDGSQILHVANGGTAGAITFSDFTVGSNTGAPLDTTNGHQFMISIVRINGIATYFVQALQ